MKNLKRRGLTCLLALAMMLSLALPALAAGAPSMEARIERDRYNKDDIVTVSIVVRNAAFNTTGCGLQYDTDSITLLHKSNNNAPTRYRDAVAIDSDSFNFADGILKMDEGKVAFAVYTAEAGTTINADDKGVEIATLRFKMLKDGKPVIAFSTVDGSTDFSSVSFKILNGAETYPSATSKVVYETSVPDPDKQKADEVDKLITAIGTVTLDKETQIKEARTAYDALTDAQKAYVTKLGVLTAAETKLAELKAIEADKAAAARVDAQIEAIGTVTTAKETQIKDARGAYEALTPAQKGYVTKLGVLTAAETKLAELKAIEADKAVAAKVDEKIAAIGTVTVDSGAKIEEARKAYNTLNDTQKGYVSKYPDLLKAEADYKKLQADAADRAAAQAVEAMINAIGTVTKDSGEKIKAARDAYDQLTDTQKALVNNYKTLTDAETALTNILAAAAVDAKIDAIGTVTKASEAKIKEARTAYDALTDAQKALVTKYDTLLAAEDALKRLQANPEDIAAAEAVEKLIDAIDSPVTKDSGEKITAARDAYDKLTKTQKDLVRNYDKLTAAEDAFKKLQDTDADKIAAAEVEKLIDAIGDVTKDSGEKIKAARDAYDKLTDDQKKLVSNYPVLEAAERAYADLTGPEMPFTDVKKGAWYYNDVLYAYQHKLVNGVTATLFDPNGTMTRAMLVTVLYRMEGEPAVTGKNPFSDVGADKYYTKAVIWAAGNGIVKGMTDTEFAPNESITREQMVAMLMRYAEYKKADTTARKDLSAFADANSVSKWAADAFKWGVSEGLVNGTTTGGKTMLVPQGTATRAQVAAILTRFMENVISK